MVSEGRNPSSLHRPVGSLSIWPSIPQAVPNAAALWWSGKPLRGVVYRFSFGLDLLPALLGLREVLAAMFAWLPRIVDRRRTRACSRSSHIIAVLLVAQNQHQAAIIKADLLGQWIARDFLESQKSFHSLGALCYWAFDFEL